MAALRAGASPAILSLGTRSAHFSWRFPCLCVPGLELGALLDCISVVTVLGDQSDWCLFHKWERQAEDTGRHSHGC